MDNNIFYVTTKVTGTNFDLTSELEAYVSDKLHALEKFTHHFDFKSHDLIFEVEVERTTNHHEKGDLYRAEINFTSGPLLRSEATDENMYLAVDSARDKMQRLMTEDANKHSGFFRKGRRMLKKLLRGE